jgi:2-amino-4-hydroxy-6-hydroxymethyldihydropteridine diphosphokinase
MARVYVSVGSNIDRERNVRSAVAALRAHYGHLVVSPVYQSPAEGFDGDDFYNLVIGFDTDEPARHVAETLLDIERAHGRERRADGMHSRTLDLDLLLHGNLPLNEPGLRLPREDIVRYAFVLKPLVDIAPEAVHPDSGRCFAQMWRDFEGDRSLRRVALDLG